MKQCSRCGDLEKRNPRGEHTQKCKDYRRNYYLKNRDKILEWMREYHRKRLSPQKKSESRKKYRDYYLAYSKWWYWGKKIEQLRKKSDLVLSLKKLHTHTHTHTHKHTHTNTHTQTHTHKKGNIKQ